MKTFEVNEPLAQKILNYLSEKPFKEVAVLINEFSRIKVADKKTPDEASDGKQRGE